MVNLEVYIFFVASHKHEITPLNLLQKRSERSARGL